MRGNSQQVSRAGMEEKLCRQKQTGVAGGGGGRNQRPSSFRVQPKVRARALAPPGARV